MKRREQALLSLRKAAQFERPTTMDVTVKSHARLVVPPAADDEYTPEQRRIVDAQLAEGMADVKAGWVHGPFSNHKEFIASLHSEALKLSRTRTKRLA